MDNYSGIDEVYSDNFSLSGQPDVFDTRSNYDIDMFFNNDWVKHYNLQQRQIMKDILPSDEDFYKPSILGYPEVNKKETDEYFEEAEKKIKEKQMEEENVIEGFNNYDSDLKCDRIMEHINFCKKCRLRILKKYKTYNGSDTIIFYVLGGIFLLFILDLLLKKT